MSSKKQQHAGMSMAAAENWFALSQTGNYWFLERVLFWVAESRKKKRSSVVVHAVGTNGLILEPERCGVTRFWFVFGDDLPPGGTKTWRELFLCEAGREMIDLQLVNVSSVIPKDVALVS